EPLAQTLDEANWYDREDGVLGKASTEIMRKWKQWVLMNPFNVLRYNLNNMSGDLDIALAYDPRILKHLNEARKDLWKDYRNKGSAHLREELDEAVRLGVLDSGFAIQDIPESAESLRRLLDPKADWRSPKFWKSLAPQGWRKTRQLTALRENLIRLAAYRHLLEEIESGRKDVYGASRKDEIDQITDPRQKAAKLARELIGDYGDVSHAGQYLRRHLIPFWSWVEINAPRYARLLRNVAHEEQLMGKRVGIFAGKRLAGRAALMAGMFALVSLWNRIFWPEEEEELGDFERQQMHLILGRTPDGAIQSIRMQGAFSDVLSWMALEDFGEDVAELITDKKSFSDQAQEMIQAPINKLYQGALPLTKSLMEVTTGRSTYPQVFEPRPVRDRWQHAAQAFSLGKVYGWAAGKPSRGWGNALSSWLVRSTDPGEAAYFQILSLVRDWNRKHHGADQGSFTPSKRSNALYSYKQALRFGDFDAAERFRQQYFDLGGSPQGMSTSIRLSEPLGQLRKQDRRRFTLSLSPKERERLRRAEAWHRQVYVSR
ncbi:MAG: hypothetical protein ACO4AU_15910, partial [bacterium]